MRKILLTAILPLFSMIAFSQEGGNVSHLGIKLGTNLSTIKMTGDQQVGIESDIMFRPMGGLFANLPVSSRLAIQPEILYSVMGAKIKDAGKDINQRFQELSVPVLLKYWVSDKVSFLAGPQLDLLMSSRGEVNNETTNNIDDLNRSNFSATGGLEVWPHQKWVLGVRYIYGLTNMRRDGDPFEWKDRAFNFSLGYKFGAKAEPKVIPPPPPPPVVDTDKDGINDPEDKCPTEPGTAKYEGCPIPDSDKDGINDEEDKCPSVPGIAKYNGCPIPDTDKDGVNDEEDKCVDVAGLARYQGCPIPDRDNDGVNDEEDRCPDLAGPSENGGCPMLEASKFNASNVQFVTGSSTLTATARKELDKAARILNEQYPQLKVEIAGHTDNTGKPEKNQILSEKRAASVKAYLVKKGITEDRLSTIGLGQDQPIADNETAAGRTKNRRVEFKVSQ
ncbi:OmpA family protein [Flavihumibacter sp.]|uniref:OmpA family protein n=1 Tax=Flavihumibacter sp. TaxID=1913981 RepID=UPI002FCA0EE1